MAPSSLHTLFLPLENGDIPLPVDGPALFLGAEWHSALGSLMSVDAYQPFRPLAAALTGKSVTLMEDVPAGADQTYALALVQVPKQGDEARFWLSAALSLLKEGGVLLAAAANDANGERIGKWMKELGLDPQSLSKNKARAVWAARPRTFSSKADEWIKKGEIQDVQIGDGIIFKTQPGVFGWDKIDMGSRMLADFLPENLKGVAADFGSGNGYLSYHLLQKNPGLKELCLLEADSRALICSKINLENVRGDCALHFRWDDLTKPVRSLVALDMIVMNPPFHEGKKTDAALGQDFIRTAAHHLKKGGRLYMVANAHLPYERLMEELFARVDMPLQKDGFKILVGVK